MATKNRVLRSINLLGETRCVDIFVRPDGSYGFEEFRRDVEDHRGWFPIGYFGARVFLSADEALRAAQAEIPWLKVAMKEG